MDASEARQKVHDLLVKTHPADHEKIELIKRLVAEHLDIERILSVATEAPAVQRPGALTLRPLDAPGDIGQP